MRRWYSKTALKESKIGAITATGGNLYHGVITATVKKPARVAVFEGGLTKVKGWPLTHRPCGPN